MWQKIITFIRSWSRGDNNPPPPPIEIKEEDRKVVNTFLKIMKGKEEPDVWFNDLERQYNSMLEYMDRIDDSNLSRQIRKKNRKILNERIKKFNNTKFNIEYIKARKQFEKDQS